MNTENRKPTVYSTTWCSDCHRAKAFLKDKGVEYHEIDIEATPEAAQIVAEHNQGKHVVPTFEIGGRFYGNPSLKELERLLGDAAAGTERRQVVIVGSGPAGFTAALYAARADLDVLVLRGAEPGGQLTTTPDVENYPGFPEGVGGIELMDKIEAQATRFGAEVRYGTVTAADLEQRPFSLTVDDEQTILADAVIISTGASARYLGLESEKRLLGRGVSACATCDGAFFRDVEIAVVGGGDTAMEEALFLTRFATRVHLIHRRGELRASKILQQRLLKNDKVEVHWHRLVRDVLGDECVDGLLLEDPRTGEVETLPVGGVFIAIGHRPNTDLFKGQLELDEHGYLVTGPDSTRTGREGVFACGDVQDPIYRQAITAAGTGSMAALDAERWLAERETEAETAGERQLAIAA